MAVSGAYASALGNLRDTVKWIVAAFTGAGAIIFSGLAVTNISGLAKSGQWIWPVVLAAVPLAAAIVVISVALRVINVTPPAVRVIFPEYWHKLTDGEGDPPAVPTVFGDELPNAVAVFGTTKNLDRRLVEALDTARLLQERFEKDPDEETRRADYESAREHLDALQPTVRDALDCAAYLEARRRYRRATKQILAAVVVAAAGLVASGVVSGSLIRAQQAEQASAAKNAAKTAPLVPDSFRTPTMVSVSFTSLPPAKAGGTHACPLWNGIHALAIGGTFTRPMLLFPGYTTAKARRHRVVPPPGQCHRPWLWSAEPGQVLVVPR